MVLLASENGVCKPFCLLTYCNMHPLFSLRPILISKRYQNFSLSVKDADDCASKSHTNSPSCVGGGRRRFTPLPRRLEEYDDDDNDDDNVAVEFR